MWSLSYGFPSSWCYPVHENEEPPLHNDCWTGCLLLKFSRHSNFCPTKRTLTKISLQLLFRAEVPVFTLSLRMEMECVSETSEVFKQFTRLSGREEFIHFSHWFQAHNQIAWFHNSTIHPQTLLNLTYSELSRSQSWILRTVNVMWHCVFWCTRMKVTEETAASYLQGRRVLFWR
jgi:hypothetical protein